MSGHGNRFDIVTHHLASSVLAFLRALAAKDTDAAADALQLDYREVKIAAPVWEFLVSPFDTLRACEQTFYELSFLDHSNKRAADIADLYAQVLTEVETLTQVIDYAKARGEYPTGPQFAAQKRGGARFDAQSPALRTSDMPDSRFSATVAAQATTLKQLLPQLITLVQTRLDMVYLYESLMNHPKTHGDFALEIETLRLVVLEGLNSITHEYLAKIVSEHRMEVTSLLNLLTIRNAVIWCRYVDAILGVAELKRQLSIWTERYHGQHHQSGSMGGGASARTVQPKRKESGSGDWSFFSAIVKAFTGPAADDEYAEESRVDAPLSPSSLHIQHLPRTMAAARWMCEYADHLTAKLELCTEHIRSRIRQSTAAIDPATLTTNRFTRSVEDALRRTASCSHQVTIMLIARSTEPDAADLQYAYLCPEPDRAVQESLLDGQLRKASWMTSGEDHSEPAGVFANPRPVVRTITGEEFMQLLPTGTNSTLRSRGSSVDSGVRHILSDSSLTGVGAMLPLASSDSTSQSITTDPSADNLILLELTKNTFSDSDLPSRANTSLRPTLSLPPGRFDFQRALESGQSRTSSYASTWVPLFARTSSPSLVLQGSSRSLGESATQAALEGLNARNDTPLSPSGATRPDACEYLTRTLPPSQAKWVVDYWSDLTAALQQSYSIAEFSADTGCPINKDALRVFSTKSTKAQVSGGPKVLFVHSRVSYKLDLACVIVEPRKQCEQVLRDFVSKFARELRDGTHMGLGGAPVTSL